MPRAADRFAAAAILVATTAFVAVVCWLHVVRPDLDPVRTGVSRYAGGDHGYAMTAGFAVLSLALLIAAPQLAGAFTRALRTASAGLLLVVLVPLRSPAPSPLLYVLHQFGGAVFFAAATIGIQAIPGRLRARRAPMPLRLAARGAAVGAAGALVLFFTSVVTRGSSLNGILGVFQRACLLAICTALVALALAMIGDARHTGDVEAGRP